MVLQTLEEGDARQFEPSALVASSLLTDSAPTLIYTPHHDTNASEVITKHRRQDLRPY
jgi:hypothetical protein